MIKRQIKKYGNTFAIKLEVADMKDFKLKEGQWISVDLEQIFKSSNSNGQVKRLIEKSNEILDMLEKYKKLEEKKMNFEEPEPEEIPEEEIEKIQEEQYETEQKEKEIKNAKRFLVHQIKKLNRRKK